MFNRSRNFLESVSIFERINISRVAQRKRAGPITQRSVDRVGRALNSSSDGFLELSKIRN
jgi:hypothetical protein